jgi:hypothetical protein
MRSNPLAKPAPRARSTVSPIPPLRGGSASQEASGSARGSRAHPDVPMSRNLHSLAQLDTSTFPPSQLGVAPRSRRHMGGSFGPSGKENHGQGDTPLEGRSTPSRGKRAIGASDGLIPPKLARGNDAAAKWEAAAQGAPAPGDGHQYGSKWDA